MKTKASGFFVVVSLLLSVPICFAQPDSRGDATIAEVGPHHRVWQRVEAETNYFLGQVVYRTNTAYVEMETGMHFVSANGEWAESKAEIELLADGAAATNLQFQVFFGANLNAAGRSGAVTLVTPESKQLRSRILGLSYFDGNKAVLIAETTDSIGLLVGSDRVHYTNAFDNADGVDATVEYVVTKAGVSQNIILKSQLPSPAEWGLNVASTRLQVLTEFFDPPEPSKSAELRATGLLDEFLDFGQMKITTAGKAYSVGNEVDDDRIVPVAKQWGVSEGRTFLVEEVPFADVNEQIQALSRRRQGASLRQDRMGEGKSMLAALKTVLPKPASREESPRVRMARLDTSNAGVLASLSSGRSFVLDYTATLSSGTNVILQSDYTYYISGTVNLYGLTTIEDAILKFAVSATATIIASNVTWKTGQYRPAIFTSKNDDSVGEVISGSSGNPTTSFAGGTVLDLTAHLNPTLSNVRFSYLSNAICGTNITLHNAQFLQCYSVFAPASATFHLRNVLGYKLHTLQKQTCGGCSPATVTAQNVTLRYVTNFISAITNASVALTNCLFVQVTNLQPATITTNSSYILSSDTGVFQTVAGAAHYLSASSPYRNAGTTNIHAGLLADLRKRTTYPPIAFTNTAITNVSALGPQAQRDTDIPDIGYEYDPLDWIFGGCDVNVDLTFQPGTAVGWFRYNQGWYHAGHGIHIADNKILNFDGKVESPCWFVHQTVAQEQLVGYSAISAGPGGITGWPTSVANSPTLNLRFTRCAGLPMYRNYFRDDNGYLRVNATHCEFYVGSVGGYISTYALTNCFFDRTIVWLDGGVLDQSIALRNCTWRGGWMSINRWSGNDHKTPVTIRDCSLDGSLVTTDDAHDTDAAITDYNYNAFLTGANRTTPQGANDVIVSSYNWQSSWFGNYYLPTNSTLINAGSRYATNAALYHFTTTTNQTKEAGTVVDIGYHFVATDGNGKPIDTDGDGAPDYWEDTNGNGNGNDDATSWQAYNSPNGLVSGSGLQVFTPLK